MDKAYLRARKAIESTYRGTLTSYEYRNVIDPDTKITNQKEVPVLTKIPCKLSFKSITNANQTETAASITQVVKLFISPETVLKEGSKLIVIQDGVETAYSSTGKPSIYPTHKEYILELFKGYA